MEKTLFELVFAIKRRCLSTEEKIQKELQITPAEFNGLLTLCPNENVPGNAFAERLGLSPSRGSRILSKLMETGFAYVNYDQEDRRRVYISLTDPGLEMKQRIENRLKECEERVLTEFSPDQVDLIKTGLSMLAESL